MWHLGTCWGLYSTKKNQTSEFIISEKEYMEQLKEEFLDNSSYKTTRH